MNIHYRKPTLNEIEKMSTQLRDSYISAYRGLMRNEYLSSLSANHWVPILQESMQKGDTCLIAEQDREIVGSSVFGIAYEEEKLYAELHAFYLSPPYIGQGIGHSFYQQIEMEMKKIGCRFCVLEVLSTNERATRFYRSHGFVRTSTFTVEENGMNLSYDQMTKAIE